MSGLSSSGLLCLAAVLALLIAEALGHTLGRTVAKSLAVAGFLGVVWEHEFPVEDYARWLFVGLHLAALGDLFLIPRGSRAALGVGLGFFLLGHVAYGMSFALSGVRTEALLAASVALVMPGAAVGYFVLPKAGRLAVPVALYIVVISGMLALALGHAALRPNPAALALALAATMFYLSDLGVARERFVEKGFVNKLLGQPLYFGAQLLFASSLP